MPLILESFHGDYPLADLLELWQHTIPNLDLRRVEWSYRNNPSGSASLFMLRDPEHSAAVGAVTVFPRLYSCHGARLLGGITGDFCVSPAHRSLGPALRLQKAALASEQFGFFLGFANEKAAAVQRMSGFRPLCPADRYYQVFRSKRILKRQYPHRPLYLTACFLDLFQRLPRLGRGIPAKRLKTLCPVTALDARVDLLWSAMRQRFDLVGRRDQAQLRWRYQQSPYRGYAFYGLEDPATDRLLGLLVYHIDDDGIAWIDDFVFADPELFFGAVLLAFVEWARQAGLDAVSLKLARNAELGARLHRAGFHRRDTGTTLLWRPGTELAVGSAPLSVCITAGDDDF